MRMLKIVMYKETLIDFNEHLWTFIGSFIGIGLIGYLQSRSFSDLDNLFLIGSFGASSVLIYGVIQSPLAQPRNLIGGHLICAFVGVTVRYLVPEIWFAAALAVSSSIVLMQITRTLHPPGGATALIAIIGSEKIKSLGYMYLISPVLSGVAILLIVALFFNNITSHRRYPVNRHWYQVWKRKYL
ncbi:HPP family protein [Ohtaekwangia koreensis]|uniref:HPP family protein n=2 Tax=Ohtaekwangia koreensis TaxID=688867 RepID=A0A1T5K8D2_9BACT|nr:HPP family protein [Ohtaekwangia koreensis]